MKELKTYISEGFFTNVGANNPIKRVIDTIKDASINDKVDSNEKKIEFANLLVPILKDIEPLIKKGRLVFEYIRIDAANTPHRVIIILEMTGSNAIKWSAGWTLSQRRWRHAEDIAFVIATDLYYETKYSPHDPKLQHIISKTIKATEFKVS